MSGRRVILKKRSARLLTVVRDRIHKEIKFEEWLAINHSYLFESERLSVLRRKHAAITTRINRAIEREYPVTQLSIPC